jgi:hypothetical protein
MIREGGLGEPTQEKFKPIVLARFQEKENPTLEPGWEILPSKESDQIANEIAKNLERPERAERDLEQMVEPMRNPEVLNSLIITRRPELITSTLDLLAKNQFKLPVSRLEDRQIMALLESAKLPPEFLVFAMEASFHQNNPANLLRFCNTACANKRDFDPKFLMRAQQAQLALNIKNAHYEKTLSGLHEMLDSSKEAPVLRSKVVYADLLSNKKTVLKSEGESMVYVQKKSTATLNDKIASFENLALLFRKLKNYYNAYRADIERGMLMLELAARQRQQESVHKQTLAEVIRIGSDVEKGCRTKRLNYPVARILGMYLKSRAYLEFAIRTAVSSYKRGVDSPDLSKIDLLSRLNPEQKESFNASFGNFQTSIERVRKISEEISYVTPKNYGSILSSSQTNESNIVKEVLEQEHERRIKESQGKI